MKLPSDVVWPDDAVTFLLIGGQDFFRGTLSPEQYLIDIKSRVPTSNGTTGILYVREMQHMPQASLLQFTLPLMLKVLQFWGDGRKDSIDNVLQALLAALASAGWSGELHFTRDPNVWVELEFNANSNKDEMPKAVQMSLHKTDPAAVSLSPCKARPQDSGPAAAQDLILPGVYPRTRRASSPVPAQTCVKNLVFSQTLYTPRSSPASGRVRFRSLPVSPVARARSPSSQMRRDFAIRGPLTPPGSVRFRCTSPPPAVAAAAAAVGSSTNFSKPAGV